MIELINSEKLYWIYAIEPKLQLAIRQTAEDFHLSGRQQMDVDSVRARMVKSLNQMIDSGFYYYYNGPREQAALMSPLLRKVADAMVSSMRKAIHMVVQSVFKKLSLEELEITAYYIDSMVIVNPSNKTESFVVFPFNDEMRKQLLEVLEKISTQQDITAYSDDLAELGCNIVTQSVHYYYHLPTNMMQIKGLSRKTADFGIETAVKAGKGLIRKAAKEVEHEKVKLLPSNVQYLVAAFDIPYETCSPAFVVDKGVVDKG